MIKTLTAVAAALLLAGAAQAATVVNVDALADSWNSGAGTGLDTGIALTAGESFTVTVAADDLWSAGALPRWSNANGLTGTLIATGTDESGQPTGTVIGTDFGLLDGFAYGELVGQIDGGAYFAVGTDFAGTANATGTLKLFYWDTYTADNSGSVAATVSVVPEPASVALMLAGLGIVGGLARRRAKHLG
jgi:PEP-CTERM motif